MRRRARNRVERLFPPIIQEKSDDGDWQVAIDCDIITSREPDDIPTFSKALLGALSD
jgi:hypothetical protein